MNLGQAVAVCLYEIARGGSHPAQPTQRGQPATAGDLDRIHAVLLDALRASGYLKPGASVPTEEKLRRLIRRLHFSSADAGLVLGMFRQILWKLRSGEKHASL